MLTPGGLAALREQARRMKEESSNLFRFIITHGLEEHFDMGEIDGRSVRFDDIGWLADEVIDYCNAELKKYDSKKMSHFVYVVPDYYQEPHQRHGRWG